MKTLLELAKMVKEKEMELAYGSETILLGYFVNEFDHVSSILDGESALDPELDVTASYDWYEEAYTQVKATKILKEMR